MRLAWIVADANPRIASFRYRCLIPAWALQQTGHESAILVDERPDLSEFDALIIVKQAGKEFHDLARAFHSSGKPVFLDLCDNIFVPGYPRRRYSEFSAQSATDLAHHIAAFVTPTRALDRVVRRHLGEGMASWIISDAVITPGVHQAMCAWLSLAAVPSALSRRRDLYVREMFSTESDWQVDYLPKDTARVIWFGHHGSFQSEFGMSLLKPVIEELERAHRDRPIELVIISNNRRKFDALTHDVRIFTRYETWSSERVFFELSRANLFVMPSGTDAFAVCKSANRAVLALANNVPVVAGYLESLEPLRDVVVLDDWRAGIEAYLFGGHTAKEHLRRARLILAEQYSVGAIGRQWAMALGVGRGEQSEPRVDCRAAVQFG
jgi:hypothetical protein